MEDRKEADFRNGFDDGFGALESLDIKRINNFDELLTAMSKTAFDGRRLGEAAEVLVHMIQSEDCLIVGTFSGAMTVAKMGSLICDMIDWGWLDIIVTTGALIAHGLVESCGLRHFKYDHSMDDKELFKKGYDRIYDTLELEKNLDDVERIVSSIFSQMDRQQIFSSESICRGLGQWLVENSEGPGILKSAYSKNVPIYIPAFTDCELGLDIATWMVKTAVAENRVSHLKQAIAEPMIRFDPFLDLGSYTTKIIEAEKIGIFTIGGGVPRNWAQQVCPYLDILNIRTKSNIPLKKFQYGVRICPEPVHWGGLSGCTYSEGVSWGKFADKSEGGMFSEVFTDATVAWPILIKAVKERIDRSAKSKS
ncbi:deoxyhypusine synthase family protein [candidate division CSSED10-310 bacterium]|uniref:Deoxyhypusine synthase family protein n=1 Tax=candidate division CSSED10-310 bacterium TaxID=2855610 RepID=A0ABV6Z6T9_UNCC1